MAKFFKLGMLKNSLINTSIPVINTTLRCTQTHWNNFSINPLVTI